MEASPRTASAVVLMARADLLAGRSGEALALARRAAALDPKCAEAFLLQGSVQQATGGKKDARVAYETYLRLAPLGAHAAEVQTILRTILRAP